jgi:hypothetical protein
MSGFDYIRILKYNNRKWTKTQKAQVGAQEAEVKVEVEAQEVEAET